MKTYKFFAIAMAAVATASCTKEIAQTNAPEENLNLSPLTLTAYNGEEDTKAAFSETKYPIIEWKADDAISVLGTSTGNQQFVAKTSGETVEFTGLADLTDETLYAVYPFNSQITLNDDGTLAGVKIPEIQTATAGSFDPKAYVAVAKSTDKSSLNFKALGSFLKFQVAEAEKVKSVTFIGNNNENIAGSANKVTVGDDPVHGGLSTSSPFVRVQGTFEAGKDYFAIIRPMTYSNGLTVCVEYWNDPAKPEAGTTIKYCSASAKVFASRNKIMKLGSAALAPTKDVTEDLYACYLMGKNIDIAGTKINRTSYPGGVLVTEDKEIRNGVFFINENVTATLTASDKTVIIGRYAGKISSVFREKQLSLKATEGEDYFHMYNVKYVTGLTSGNMLGVNGDEAKTFVFESISFEKCEFEVPKDMNFMYAQYNIASFSMVDCDIKLHANTSEKNILSTNTNNTTEYALTFKNNIFYCTDGDVTGYQVFKNTNAILSSVEFSKNTFAKVYAKASYSYISAKTITLGKVENNLFFIPDYTTLVKGTDGNTKYTGILYASDKVNTGFTFTSNLAYYDEESVPSVRMKADYHVNDGKGQFYHKFGTDNPLATADFTNGIFTQKEAYSAYGAKR